jgi:2-succinyl-6-hydroxy-2,4-cyclohexadiene-1-carboxylate synthase
MLHGFTQTGACFDELSEELGVRGLAPDLPGHGADPGSQVTLEVATAEVAHLLRSLGRPTPLLGYSQGGRVALHVALAHPELVSLLVIVSASPGLSDPEERAQRAQIDEERAQALLSDGVERFLDHWSSLPMFEGLLERGEDWLLRDRARRGVHVASGLAAALRGLGLSQQADLQPRLSELQMPALFVAGTNDPAYVEHAFQMASEVPRGVPVFLPRLGHAIVGQSPASLARVIRSGL